MTMPAPVKPLTPTELRMYRILSDGLPHSKYELHECLDDPLADLTSIQMHLSRLRGKILPKGETVVCLASNFKYQLLRTLSNPYNGVR